MSHCMALTVYMKKWVLNGAREFLNQRREPGKPVRISLNGTVYGWASRDSFLKPYYNMRAGTEKNASLTSMTSSVKKMTSSAELMRSIGNNEISIWATILSTFVTCHVTKFEKILKKKFCDKNFHVTCDKSVTIKNSPIRKMRTLTKNFEYGEFGWLWVVLPLENNRQKPKNRWRFLMAFEGHFQLITLFMRSGKQSEYRTFIKSATHKIWMHHFWL